MTDPDASVPGAPSDNTTLVAVLDQFARAGYAGTMVATESAAFRCTDCGRTIAAADVHVHELRRLEGASDPADMMVVLAVECPNCGNHAAVVVGYGPEASAADADVLRALDV